MGLLGKFYRAESIPALREARGKIVALNRCESSEDTSCIPNLGGIPIRIGDKTSYQSSKKYNAAQDYYMGKATSFNNDDKKCAYIEGFYKKCMQTKASDAACQGKLKLNYVSITMPDTLENYSQKLNIRVLRAFENRKGWSILIIDSFDKGVMQALASDTVEATMQ